MHVDDESKNKGSLTKFNLTKCMQLSMQKNITFHYVSSFKWIIIIQ